MANKAVIELIARLSADSKEFARGFSAASTTVRDFARDVARQTQDLSRNVALGAGALGTAIVGSFAMAAKSAGEFHRAMGEVATLLENPSTEGLKKLADGIDNVAMKFGVDALDGIKAVYQALSSGVPENNVVTFLETASMAAVAGVASLTEVTDLGTSVMNAYGMNFDVVGGKMEGLEKVLNSTFKAVVIGRTTFAEMAASIGRVAPLAASLGIGIDELNGAIAKTTLGGLSTAEAITGLKAAFMNILKPSKDAEEAMQALGISFDAATLKTMGLEKFLAMIRDKMKEMSDDKGNITILDDKAIGKSHEAIGKLEKKIKDLTEALGKAGTKGKESLQKQLAGAIKKLAEEQKELTFLMEGGNAKIVDQATFLTMLFGSVEAVNSVLQLMNTEGKTFAEVMEYMHTPGDAMAEAFKKMVAADPTFVFRQMTASLGVLWRAIGSIILTALAPLSYWLAIVMGNLVNWVKANPELLKTLVMVAAGIGIGFLALSAFAAGLFLVVTAASMFGLALIAMLSGILLIVAPAFLVLVGLGVLLYQNWETIKQWAIANWPIIKEQIMTAVNAIRAAFMAALPALLQFWGSFKAWAADAWALLVRVLQWFLTQFIPFLVGRLSALATTVLPMVIAVLGQLWELFKAGVLWVISNWPMLQDMLLKFYAMLYEKTMQAIDTLGRFWEALKRIWQSMNDIGLLKGIWVIIEGGLTAAGRAMSILNALFSYGVGVLETYAGWMQKIVDLYRNIPGIEALLGKAGPAAPGAPKLPGFARGGIVSRKTVAHVGEKGPEAIIPLAGGAVPVKIDSGGSGGGAVGSGSGGIGGGDMVINIHKVPSESTESLAQRVSELIMRRRGVA